MDVTTARRWLIAGSVALLAALVAVGMDKLNLGYCDSGVLRVIFYVLVAFFGKESRVFFYLL